MRLGTSPAIMRSTQPSSRGKRQQESSPQISRKRPRRRLNLDTPDSKCITPHPEIATPDPEIATPALRTPHCYFSIPASLKRHWYMMDLDSGRVIDSEKYGNISRLINHSCDPNCVAQKWRVGYESRWASHVVIIDVEHNRVGIFTLRTIKVGEELGYDYRYWFRL